MKRNKKQEYIKYKEIARQLAKERIAHFNVAYNFTVNRISIKNQKSRWGSCSKKGNLNFNYRVALLPERLADYVILHELCHLGEFNHSLRFWDLVAKTMPSYKKIRQEFKKIPIR